MSTRRLPSDGFTYAQENDERLPWFGWSPYRADRQWWVTQVAAGIEQFEPDLYRCPSDPLPMFVPVYMFNGALYMDDQCNASQGFGVTIDGESTGTRHEGHEEGRSFTILCSYRGSCDLYYEIGGGNDSTLGFETYRITLFSDPSKIMQMVEGVFEEQYERGVNPQRECFQFHNITILATEKGYKYHTSFGRHFNTGNVCFLDGHVANKTPLDQAAIASQWQTYLTPQANNARRGTDVAAARSR